MLTPLGRDQGIFQYIAWAILQGAKDYRDVRDVNGPLTHLVHVVLLLLGGADDFRFHQLDLLITGFSFAIVGACIPGVGARRPPHWIERAGWAFAGWVVLSVQYLQFSYWDLAQRESFFDWFMLPSVGLQLVALRPTREQGAARRRRWLLGIAGGLSVVPWFGKPTYVTFTLAQALTLVVDDGHVTSVNPRPRREGWIAFGAGGVAAAIVMLGLLAVIGDVAAYARIAFVDVPAMYRFIWTRSAQDIFARNWYSTQGMLAFAGATVMLALIAFDELPRRTLAIALLPLCGVVSVVAQGKGFPYHFHPITAGVYLQWLVLTAWTWERLRGAPRRDPTRRLVPFFVSGLLALTVADEVLTSPHTRAVSLSWEAVTREQRSRPEYFAMFPEVDYFPWELRQAAKYLREHTAPGDRVQTYGMDPYVLFFAQRQSATPYIYAYDLNCDAALAGASAARPDEDQAARIRAICEAHGQDLLQRIQAEPPAAFVFFDKSPLISQENAWSDFQEHQPAAAAWVSARYRETATFGPDHVWLRNDLF